MPATLIQNNDPRLLNLQANILKGHGRNFAKHLFFKIATDNIPMAKKWIAGFAKNSITTARQQIDDAAAYKTGKDGGTLFTLSLSASGYKALGLEASQPGSPVFQNGLAGSLGRLDDDKESWETPYKERIDMLIIVADDDNSKAIAAASDIENQTRPFAKLLLNQEGNVLKNKNGGIEHFGYADGVSQPFFLQSDVDPQTTTNEWDDATDASLVLEADPGAHDDSCFGSYLVFRKLEQNVKAFKDAEGDNKVPGVLPIIKDVSGKDNDELAGAMLVGRFENSTPVVKSSIEDKSSPFKVTNDFNYADDLDATKCPFHAHIRLMNPRKGDTIAGELPDQRITRRGIPFDEVNRIPLSDITDISDEMLDANQPEKGVGLLFMCYQKDISNQFEILQAFWATGQVGAHAIGAEDSIISQGANPDKTLPEQWGKPAQTYPFNFGKFVTMKGGEYFFTPSLCFLKQIGNATRKA